MPQSQKDANRRQEFFRIARLRPRADIGNTLRVSLINVQPITSFDAPELEPYRTMRRPTEHAQRGIFVAEGDKVVQRLLESHFHVISVVLPENRLEEFRPLLESRPEQINVYLAERKFLVTLVGIELFQGVLAVGKIPRTFSLADLLAQSPSPRLFATVEGLTNAENIGLLVRNCAAFGTQGLIVSPTCCSPFLRRAVRNSMGTIFQMPVVETADLIKSLTRTARRRRTLHRSPSAHGQKDAGADGFHRRLLPGVRQ
jgi:tRNA G18 (ribose-2'-O)-methylase SpoU